jgi:SPP1 gp7 family putative phage head morphogenesis protein
MDTRTLLQKEGLWGTVEVTDPITGEPLKTTFNEARLRLIHDTNVRQALAAGQWQRMLRNQARYPYARYVAMDDERTRPDHRAWHNTVLPIDHPWWSTQRPPNGYHCRCRVIGLTQAEFEHGFSQSRPGAETDENAPLVRETFKTEPPPEQLLDWRNPRTGEVQKIPKGIDPGFDHSPGTGAAAKATD